MTGRGDASTALQRACGELERLIGALNGSLTPASAELITEVERAGRLVDAARVLAVVPLARDHLIAERLGFASSVAAVAGLARVTERTAGQRLRLARDTRPDVSVSGAPLPPRYEHVATALVGGTLGVEAATRVVRELDAVAPRVAEPAR